MSDELVNCLVCGGSGSVVMANFGGLAIGQGLPPAQVQTCTACRGAGKVMGVVTLTAGSFVDPRDAEIAHLKSLITQLQADNTRLLEERRAVDERYMVEHFHRLLPAPVLPVPQVPSSERVQLRVRLITEEYLELLECCFVTGAAKMKWLNAKDELNTLVDGLVNNVDMVEFADACADLKYVIVGAELEFGIDGRPIFKGVHEANMRKIGGPKRADGKGLKPEGWRPFDVAMELRRQGWRGP
jgi:predicted HAD superfamily Cof-like phosphohydrolase